MTPIERLLGTWDVVMDHSQVAEPVRGRQRYERVLGGAFVMLTWTYDRPDFPDAIALLDEHRYHHFDVRGVIRVFEAEFDDNGWSMTYLDETFSQRSVATHRGPDSIESRGDYSEDRGETWHHDFTMSYRRVDEPEAIHPVGGLPL